MVVEAELKENGCLATSDPLQDLVVITGFKAMVKFYRPDQVGVK